MDVAKALGTRLKHYARRFDVCEASTVVTVRVRECVARITVSQPTVRVSVVTSTTNTAALCTNLPKSF